MLDSQSKKLQQLNTLVEMTALINSTLDPYAIKTKVIEAATRLLDSESGSLILIDPKTKDLYFEVAVGEKSYEVKSIRVKKGMGVAGWVAEHGNPVITNDIASEPRFYEKVDKTTGFITKNMVCVPVKSKERTIGVLQTINKNIGNFDYDDMVILYALANQVAVAIENSHLYQKSITDSLTGLYHHEHFKATLKDEIDRANKYKHTLSLVMLDIDLFKKVNDTYGHLVGDMAIKRIAGILKHNTRKSGARWGDVVARYGGEEFVVILPYASYENTFKVGERFRKKVEETNFDGIRLTTSVGIGHFNAQDKDKDSHLDYERLIKLADQCLYKAKENGRNRVEIERITIS